MRRTVWLMLVMVLHAAVLPWATPTLRADEKVAAASCCGNGVCCCAAAAERGGSCPCVPRPERPTTPTGVATTAVKAEATASPAKRAVVRAERVIGTGRTRAEARARVSRHAAGAVRAWRGPPVVRRAVLNIWTT
jgi:hypothetical protein